VAIYGRYPSRFALDFLSVSTGINGSAPRQ
jgi:hypothetical protein